MYDDDENEPVWPAWAVDDDDDNKPVWSIWAVGALFRSVKRIHFNHACETVGILSGVRDVEMYNRGCPSWRFLAGCLKASSLMSCETKFLKV